MADAARRRIRWRGMVNRPGHSFHRRDEPGLLLAATLMRRARLLERLVRPIRQGRFAMH